MATGFSRRRGRVTAGLEPGEVRLLDTLFGDVESLLSDGTALADESRPADPLAAELGLADLDLVDPDTVVRTPDDTALARLLPPGTTDDPELAADYRRLTDGSLRRRKVEGLRSVRRSLAEAVSAAAGAGEAVEEDGVVTLRLDADQARAWVVAFTDLRLVLADRLGIETDEDAEALHHRLAAGDGADDPSDADDADGADGSRGGGAWMALVYDFVSWLQESLAEALLRDLPARGDGRRTAPPGT